MDQKGNLGIYIFISVLLTGAVNAFWLLTNPKKTNPQTPFPSPSLKPSPFKSNTPTPYPVFSPSSTFLPTPSSTAIPVFPSPTNNPPPSTYHSSEPYLQVVPQTTSNGSTVTIIGTGFCGLASCTTVNFKVYDKTNIGEAHPDNQGGVSLRYLVNLPLGIHTLRATQTKSDGSSINVLAQFNVPATDYR